MPRKLFDADYISQGLRIMTSRVEGDIAPHTHEFVELVIVTGGSGRHLVSEGSYTVRGGDTLVIPPGISHGYTDCVGLEVAMVLLTATPEMIPWGELSDVPGFIPLFAPESTPVTHGSGNGSVHLDVNGAYRVRQLIRDIQAESDPHMGGSRHMVKALTMQLIIKLSRAYAEGAGTPDSPGSRLDVILDFLDRSFAEDIRLDQLAVLGHISRSGLIRSFKAVLGTTPGEYVRQLRLERSARLISEGKLTLAEIAAECGFSDASHLSRSFTRFMGSTPRAYGRIPKGTG